ncbi:MAG: hypothetical protein R3F30_07805 [Planctomycetota bacterium]
MNCQHSDAEDAVGNWRKLLNSFDSLDSQLKDFREQASTALRLTCIEGLELAQGPPPADQDRPTIVLTRRRTDLSCSAARLWCQTETDFDAEAAAAVTPASGSSDLLERLRKKAEAKKPGVPTGDGG